MKTKFLFALMLAAALSLPVGGAALAQTSPSYPLPGDKVYPEGVAYQPTTGDFFAGGTTDGTVFRGNVAAPETEAEVFLEPGTDGRETAIGMKVDADGRLFIAGGDTGKMFVYDTATGALNAAFDNEAEMTFVNDVTLTPDGSAYFTDSMTPELYRLYPDGAGGYEMETFVSFEGTPLKYEEGFNLNGIAATADGRYLITVKSGTGQLFRIDTTSKEVVEIDTGDADLTNGDGILLDGQTLYVVRNQNELIVPVQLSADYSSGEAGEGFTDDSLMYPTTAAFQDGRLLAVNSQFDVRDEGGAPELPFNLTSIQIPEEALPESGGVKAPFVLVGGALAAFATAGYLTLRSHRIPR